MDICVRPAKSFDRGFRYFRWVASGSRANLDNLFRNNIGKSVLPIYQAKLSKDVLVGTIKNCASVPVELALFDQLIDRHLRLLCRRSIN
jgi:hypothetical protein